jgi:hypothetical protein
MLRASFKQLFKKCVGGPGTRLSKARNCVRVALEPLEDRLTPALSAVANTSVFPASAVVELQTQWQDGNTCVGTGVMIDSFHVLTAGHMIYDYSEGGTPQNPNGGFAQQIIVTPGLHGNSAPFGQASMVWERITTGYAGSYMAWSENHPHQRGQEGMTGAGSQDIGLITLDRAIGNSTGWLGMWYFGDDPNQLQNIFNGFGVSTAGYPGSNTHPVRLQDGETAVGNTMYQEPGTMSGVSSDGSEITWWPGNMESHPGQSGSPLAFRDPKGGISVVGILVTDGAATRISQSCYNWLEGGIQYDAVNRPPQPAPAPSSGSPATSALAAYASLASTPNSSASSTFTGTGTQAPPPGVSGTPPGATVPPSQTVTVPPKAHPKDSIGVFDPSTATWYLRTSNSPGGPDAGQFQYGAPGWISLIGDWTGSGHDGIGVYDPATATWYLRNEASPGAPDAGQFRFGAPGWIPVVGDWTGSGHMGIGVYDPATATWYLRKEASAGAPDVGQFAYGAAGWVPVVGDWSGSGKDGIGVLDPSTATWYLRNEAGAGAPDAGQFAYGAPGWLPVVGDWTGSGKDGIGMFDPNTGTWYLRNEAGAGAPDAGRFAYGAAGWQPLSGVFSSSSAVFQALGAPTNAALPILGDSLDLLPTDALEGNSLSTDPLDQLFATGV